LDTSGGGVFNDGGGVSAYNTLIARNTAAVAPDFQGSFAVAVGNLLGVGDGSNIHNSPPPPKPGVPYSHSNVFGGLGKPPIDPSLGPLANNGGPTRTHALLSGSVAINHGDNASVPPGVTTDQRGFLRIAGGVVDIGAYE